MATKRNDDKGYERGARGIDGRDGESFVKPRSPLSGPGPGVAKVNGNDGGPDSKGLGAAQSSAKGK